MHISPPRPVGTLMFLFVLLLVPFELGVVPPHCAASDVPVSLSASQPWTGEITAVDTSLLSFELQVAGDHPGAPSVVRHFVLAPGARLTRNGAAVNSLAALRPIAPGWRQEAEVLCDSTGAAVSVVAAYPLFEAEIVALTGDIAVLKPVLGGEPEDRGQPSLGSWDRAGAMSGAASPGRWRLAPMFAIEADGVPVSAAAVKPGTYALVLLNLAGQVKKITVAR